MSCLLTRVCHTLEQQLLTTNKRGVRLAFPFYIKAKSDHKPYDPVVNRMLDTHDNISSSKRSWLIDQKVYRYLREKVLLLPKFADQVVMCVPPVKQVELSKKLSECNEKLQHLNAVKDMHRFLSDIMLIIKHMNKDHVMPLLERECCLRLDHWTVKEILFAMDVFYCCQWKAAMLYRSSFKWFDLKLNKLNVTPEDLIQLLFYIALYRDSPVTLMRQIEDRLTKQIDSFSPAELGIVCHAFFVTNTSILNYDLLEHLSWKLLAGITANSIGPSLIGNYLKVFRHAQYEDLHFYEEICNLFCKQPAAFGRYANMQLFKTLSSLHFYHRDYCLSFVSHWENINLSKVPIRFKTMVDIVWSCAVFGIKPPRNIADKLMDTVQSEYKKLSQLYPEKFIEGLLALVLTDKYPQAAISYALSPRVEKENAVLEQLYQCQLLDESVEILCPQYQGYRLPERWIAQFQNYKVNLIKQVEWRKGLRVILERMQVLLGNCVRVDTVLLSSQVPVLLIKVDENSVPIPLLDDEPVFFDDVTLNENFSSRITSYSSKEDDDITWPSPNTNSVFDNILEKQSSLQEPLFHYEPDYATKPSIRKLVVMVLGRNQFHRNADVLHGLYPHIIKMMLKLDYEVIGISPLHAAEVELMTSNELKQFIKVMILDKFGITY